MNVLCQNKIRKEGRNVLLLEKINKRLRLTCSGLWPLTEEDFKLT